MVVGYALFLWAASQLVTWPTRHSQLVTIRRTCKILQMEN